MSTPDHIWELVDAVQYGEGADALELSWRCLACGADWETIDAVTMPDWESGQCTEDVEQRLVDTLAKERDRCHHESSDTNANR